MARAQGVAQRARHVVLPHHVAEDGGTVAVVEARAGLAHSAARLNEMRKT